MNKTDDTDCLFVCCACGKTSTTRYGYREIAGGLKYENTASPGWDESCMLNAQEFAKSRLVWNADHTRVVEVRQ